MKQSYKSWGLYPKANHKTVLKPSWISEALKIAEGKTSVLPYGLGRSYGDNCLNNDNILIDTTNFSKFIKFDVEKGILKCEAGLSFAKILEIIVPSGWFFPVTPGTKFVTIGGAIANDVHGKNHHVAGTFGNHVTKFELLRSNSERLVCSKNQNTELFKATIGGLGLTGLILWAEFKLKPIKNAFIDTETIKFESLEEFFELSQESSADYEYTVSWIDCSKKGATRGVFFRGNHSNHKESELPKAKQPIRFPFPFMAPSFLLNRLTIKIANTLMYRSQIKKHIQEIKHYDSFFYPLDFILNWNRMYGKKGFFQYQCVVPMENSKDIKKVLDKIVQSRMGSFLVVFKTMGDVKSPGCLSFPRKGVTLALDFPNRGERTLVLMNELDKLVKTAGGALYPCKDARMSPEMFRFSFDKLDEFVKYIDPKFSSSQWRRLRGQGDEG